MQQKPKYKYGDTVYILCKEIHTNNFTAVKCSVIRTYYNESSNSYSYHLIYSNIPHGLWKIVNIKKTGINANDTIYIEMPEKDLYANANACLNAA